MTVIWSRATEEERRMLHRAARAVGVHAGLPLRQIFQEAYGGAGGIGPDDVANSRKGKIGRDKAERIYRWIARRYPEIGQAAAPEIFGTPPGDDFEDHIRTHARSGDLGVKLMGRFGLIERAAEATAPDASVLPGQAFCFELTSEIDGIATARQGYKGTWHSLPLGAGGFATCAIRSGAQLLPADANGTPIELFEREDTGMHRIVVIVAHKTLAARLETFDTETPDTELLNQAQVHQLYLFVGEDPANG